MSENGKAATKWPSGSLEHLDAARHRVLLEELCAFPRETATDGERRAAEWVAERLAALGCPARLEEERLHSTFWWPLGLASGTGVVAGLAGLRGHRLTGAALGALAAAAAADDTPPDGARRLRSVLPKGTVTQVVAELGPVEATRTVVVLAHHDAAHSGLIFHPEIPEIADRLGLIERSDTSPPLMWFAVAGQLLAAAGSAAGRRSLAATGAVLSAAFAAAMANIGMSRVVPGANDNGTAVVALLALAQALVERPTESVRMMLVSTSEEATCEGMQAFARRHFPRLPRERTFFLGLDTLGSPHLLVLRGEGMLKMREYPPRSLALMDGLAEELGIWLYPNLRLRNATDAVYPLAAGYECATLCSCTDLKQAANYHWPTDTPENVRLLHPRERHPPRRGGRPPARRALAVITPPAPPLRVGTNPAAAPLRPLPPVSGATVAAGPAACTATSSLVPGDGRAA